MGSVCWGQGQRSMKNEDPVYGIHRVLNTSHSACNDTCTRLQEAPPMEVNRASRENYGHIHSMPLGVGDFKSASQKHRFFDSQRPTFWVRDKAGYGQAHKSP